VDTFSMSPGSSATNGQLRIGNSPVRNTAPVM
jgi:hypothetical protein